MKKVCFLLQQSKSFYFNNTKIVLLKAFGVELPSALNAFGDELGAFQNVAGRKLVGR